MLRSGIPACSLQDRITPTRFALPTNGGLFDTLRAFERLSNQNHTIRV